MSLYATDDVIMSENVFMMAEDTIDCLRMARTAQLLGLGYEWSRAEIIAHREAAYRTCELMSGEPVLAVLKYIQCAEERGLSTWNIKNSELAFVPEGKLDLRF